MSISRRDVMKATLAVTAGAFFARCMQATRPGLGNWPYPYSPPSARVIPENYVLTPGHPRLYVTSAELPELRLRAQTTQVAELDSLLALYTSRAAVPPPATASATAPTTGPGRRRGGGANAETIVRLSLLYLITGDKEHARVATNEVERLLQIPVDGTYRGAPRRTRALSIAYDYLYDHLDDSYKRRIIKNMAEISDIAAEVKKKLKSMHGSNYFVDRRADGKDGA